MDTLAVHNVLLCTEYQYYSCDDAIPIEPLPASTLGHFPPRKAATLKPPVSIPGPDGCSVSSDLTSLLHEPLLLHDATVPLEFLLIFAFGVTFTWTVLSLAEVDPSMSLETGAIIAMCCVVAI